MRQRKENHKAIYERKLVTPEGLRRRLRRLIQSLRNTCDDDVDGVYLRRGDVEVR